MRCLILTLVATVALAAGCGDNETPEPDAGYNSQITPFQQNDVTLTVGQTHSAELSLDEVPPAGLTVTISAKSADAALVSVTPAAIKITAPEQKGTFTVKGTKLTSGFVDVTFTVDSGHWQTLRVKVE